MKALGHCPLKIMHGKVDVAIKATKNMQNARDITNSFPIRFQRLYNTTILMYRIYQIGIQILVLLCTCINNIKLGTFIKVSRIYIFLYLYCDKMIALLYFSPQNIGLLT